jgi:copper homeostasis protein
VTESTTDPAIRNDRLEIEVCVGSLARAVASEKAGADRIELNQALELDGLTPSPGLFSLVFESLRIPVIAMVRPRAGDFFYSAGEWRTMLRDASWLLEQGVDGLAFGALSDRQQVDVERCLQMRRLSEGRELVFHKAFDDISDPLQGLEALVDLGMDRVMTSGQAPTAIEGAPIIAKLLHQSRGRIGILPAGRIDSRTTGELIQRTGCRQVHGSFSRAPENGLKNELDRVRAHVCDGQG